MTANTRTALGRSSGDADTTDRRPTGGVPAHARALAELAGRHARDADRTGMLAPDVVEALRVAGFARHFRPRVAGGAQGTFGELIDALTVVGSSCASTAWCASKIAHSARFAAYLPADAQEEIRHGNAGEPLWVSGLVPGGLVKAEPGGYRLSGQWPYVSGALWADWALLTGPRPGKDAPAARMFAVPPSAFRVEETWNATGLRATGSHTVVVENYLVPQRFAVLAEDVVAGRTDEYDVVQLDVPLPAVGGLSALAPAVGAARGAVVAALGSMTGKRTGDRTTLARGAALVDAAHLLMRRVADDADRGDGRRQAGRCARDLAVAGQLVTEGVADLIRAVGTAAYDRSGALERFWRDTTVATSHAALRLDRWASLWVDREVGN